ncbi:MAG: ATP-binding protein [Acidobacteriota bacterium]
MYRLDMHVHTCLSPCGDLDMHPSAIVDAGAGANLHGLAVCDHHAADNLPAVQRAGKARGLAVLPGMEITTEEEVHLLALLPDATAAGVLQARVSAVLPGRNVPDIFGLQVIANERAEVLGFNESRLAGATTWNLERAVDEIHRVEGLAIAAHADRERSGIVGQLGFVPPGLALDAIEVSAATTFDLGRARLGLPLGLPVVTGSDAHDPASLGRAITYWYLDDATPREVRLALRGEGGRAVLGGGRPMEDLALHILDLARNGLEAGATRIEIDVSEDLAGNRLTISVRDNGRGMHAPVVARAADPFFTTRGTRDVGLGLPLLKQAAEAARGALRIDSVPGQGTVTTATFEHRHVDRAPLGDLETTVLVLMASSPEVELVLTHRRSARAYTLASSDLRAALGECSWSSPEAIALVRGAIRHGEASLEERGHEGS